MGKLRYSAPGLDDRLFELRSMQQIGRWSGCLLRVDEDCVSNTHASITWGGDVWWIRDLNSTRGTRLNGSQLGKGNRPLAPGDLIEIDHHRWTVVDVDPPALSLEPRGDADTIVVPSRVGIALLPSVDDPQVALVRAKSGGWQIERDDDASLLVTGMELVLGGTTYVVDVPEPHAQTADRVEQEPSSLSRAHIEIAVSSDEEEAGLTLSVAGTSHSITDRKPLYLLALLARARRGEVDMRLVSKRMGSLDPDGWLSVDEVMAELGTDKSGLNLDVFRVRECVRNFGIQGANEIIERRRGRLRIGVEPSRLRIVKQH